MEEVWLSWSRLRTHEECRQKAYLQRTGKKATVDNHRNFIPGNITDRVVRDFLLNDPYNNLGTMPDMVPEYLDRAVAEAEKQGGWVKWKAADGSDHRTIIEKCTKAVTRIEEDLKRLVLPYEYTPDFSFRVPLEVPVRGRDEPITIMLNGFMDILVKRGEGDFTIWDVKHTEDNSYWKKTFGQLSFYDTALTLMEGFYSKQAGLLQPLCTEHVKNFELTRDDRKKMLQSIQGYAQDYVNHNVTPTDKISLCSMCNVKHACSRFKGTMKNGKKVISL
jgi:hypothetical protein